jgi:hypothetical protein
MELAVDSSTANTPLFFGLSSLALAFVVFAIMIGATAIGVLAGRSQRHRMDHLREPVGALQGALLGFMALIMAFGLSLAVGRYESRRTAVVDDANTIGTTYLRAQTLAEPQRTPSLALLVRYTDVELALSRAVPGSTAQVSAVAAGSAIQNQLWTLAGASVAAAPVATAPRLYIETLNEMIDQQTRRVAALNDRIPTSVLLLEVIGSAMALGILAAYFAILGKAIYTVLVAAVLVSAILLVTFDLDRPTRGLIRIPTTSLDHLRASMDSPPAVAP